MKPFSFARLSWRTLVAALVVIQFSAPLAMYPEEFLRERQRKCTGKGDEEHV